LARCATRAGHVAFALREGRVIFTNDSDFLRLADSGARYGGICYCHPEKSDIGHVALYLALLSECLSPDQCANRIEFL
jgi:hypothetical protein